jgi:prepilin-type N-terminal cleavage/methylation domain-containing protein
MRLRRRTRGSTLMEVMAVVSILGMLAVVISTVWIGVLTSYDDVTTQTYTNTDAATVIQRMVTDVREANNVQTLDSNTHLKIFYPVQDANGDYDRHTQDPVHTVEYYRSDSNGATNGAGNYLWRKETTAAGQTKRVIARDINSILFQTDTDMSRAVEITVDASNTVVLRHVTRAANMTQRVVYMRNHP